MDSKMKLYNTLPLTRQCLFHLCHSKTPSVFCVRYRFQRASLQKQCRSSLSNAFIILINFFYQHIQQQLIHTTPTINMKSTCIATIAILGCASAAPHRMRVRDLQGSMSLPLDVATTAAPEAEVATPETLPAAITTAAPEPELISAEPELSMPAVEESMPEMEASLSAPAEVLPEDEVVVEEVLWESLSIPAIYEEIYGSSMSMPEAWTPEEAGFVPSETGSGYVEPTTTESDDVSVESDDVTEEPSSASTLTGAVSAACVVAAMALF
jgi:hypothetical protein